MSYFVYVLQSKKDQQLYVGCSTDVEIRLKRHNAGAVDATRFRRPLVLIHKEQFENKAEAFNRERFLKSLWGARAKRRILNKYRQSRAS